MCGIFLKYLREPSNLEETKKRLESIRHRGPDDIRHIVHRNWFLGFTRLAIVSLNEQANQPISNPNIPVTNYLICNGEIYNYQYLKSTLKHDTFSQSDCEVGYVRSISVFNHFRFYYPSVSSHRTSCSIFANITNCILHFSAALLVRETYLR